MMLIACKKWMAMVLTLAMMLNALPAVAVAVAVAESGAGAPYVASNTINAADIAAALIGGGSGANNNEGTGSGAPPIAPVLVPESPAAGPPEGGGQGSEASAPVGLVAPLPQGDEAGPGGSALTAREFMLGAGQALSSLAITSASAKLEYGRLTLDAVAGEGIGAPMTVHWPDDLVVSAYGIEQQSGAPDGGLGGSSELGEGMGEAEGGESEGGEGEGGAPEGGSAEGGEPGDDYDTPLSGGETPMPVDGIAFSFQWEADGESQALSEAVGNLAVEPSTGRIMLMGSDGSVRNSFALQIERGASLTGALTLTGAAGEAVASAQLVLVVIAPERIPDPELSLETGRVTFQEWENRAESVGVAFDHCDGFAVAPAGGAPGGVELVGPGGEGAGAQDIGALLSVVADVQNSQLIATYSGPALLSESISADYIVTAIRDGQPTDVTAVLTVEVAAGTNPVISVNTNKISFNDDQDNHHIDLSVSVADGDASLGFAYAVDKAGMLDLSYEGGGALRVTLLPYGARSPKHGVATIALTAVGPHGREAEPVLVEVDVLAVNHAPVISVEPKSVQMQEDKGSLQASFRVAVSDREDGDGIKWDFTPSAELDGMLMASRDGDAVVLTLLNWNIRQPKYGAGKITVHSTDSGGHRASVDVPLEVIHVNHEPEIAMESVIADGIEDEAIDVDVAQAFSDPDGDELTYYVAKLPDAASGALIADGAELRAGSSFKAGMVTFVPAEHWNGEATFELYARDGDGEQTGNVAFTVRVAAVNDRPEASGVLARADEDSAGATVDLQLSVSDVEDAPADMTYELVPESPIIANLTYSLSADGVLTLVPDAGYNSAKESGDIVLFYRAVDGEGLASEPAEIRLIVVPVNHAPTFAQDVYPFEIYENSERRDEAQPGEFGADLSEWASDIDLSNVLDVEGVSYADALSFSIKEGGEPKYGIATIVDGALSYVVKPEFAHYNGQDSFTVVVTDAKGLSAECQVVATIRPVSDYSVLADDQFPASGDLFKQFPTPTMMVLDVLANDSCVDADPALNQYEGALWTMAVSGCGLAAGDAEGKTALGGSVRIVDEGARIEYTPPKNLAGTDEFYYWVVREEGMEPVLATVRVILKEKNYPPEVVLLDTNEAGGYDTDEDRAITIHFTIEDDSTQLSAMDPMVRFNSAQLTSATLALVDADAGLYALTMVPVKDFNGDTEVSLIVSDLLVATTKVVKLHVNPINDRPVAKSFTASCAEDSALSFALDAAGHVTDVDSAFPANIRFVFDAEAALAAYPDAFETLTYENGQVNITFKQDFNTTEGGAISLPFWVEDNGPQPNAEGAPVDGDGWLRSLTAGAINITVTPVNDAPVIEGKENYGPIEMDEDQQEPAEVAMTWRDVETKWDQLIVRAVANVQGIVNCQVVPNESGGVLVITPIEDANTDGIDDFYVTVTVSDGYLFDSVVVPVTVRPVPDAPVAFDWEFDTEDDTVLTMDVLVGAYDVDGDSVAVDFDSIDLSSVPGELRLVDGKLAYRAPFGYEGDVTFSYSVIDDSDAALRSEPRTVTVHISRKLVSPAIEQLPNVARVAPVDGDLAMSQLITVRDVPEGQRYTVTMKLVEPDYEMLKNVALSGDGSIVDNGDGTFTFSGISAGRVNELRLSYSIAQYYVGDARFEFELEADIGTNGQTEMRADSAVMRLYVFGNELPHVAKDIEAQTELGASVQIDVLERSADGGYANIDTFERPMYLALNRVNEAQIRYGSVRCNPDGTVTYTARDDLIGTGPWTEEFEYYVINKSGNQADNADQSPGKIVVEIAHVDRAPIGRPDMYVLNHPQGKAGETISYPLGALGVLGNDIDYDYAPGAKPGEGMIRVKSVQAAGASGAAVQNADGTWSVELPADIAYGTWMAFEYIVETVLLDGAGNPVVGDDGGYVWVPAESPARLMIAFEPYSGGGTGPSYPVIQPLAMDAEIWIDEDAPAQSFDFASYVNSWPHEGWILSLSAAQNADALTGLSQMIPVPDASSAEHGLAELCYTSAADRADRYKISYAVAPDFNGDITVNYQVTNGKESDIATLTIHVRPRNDRPVFAEADHDFSTGRDNALETAGAPYVLPDAEVVRGSVAKVALTGLFDVDNVAELNQGMAGADALNLRFRSGNMQLADATRFTYEQVGDAWTISIPTSVEEAWLPDRDRVNEIIDVKITVTLSDGTATSYGEFVLHVKPRTAPEMIEYPDVRKVREDGSTEFIVVNAKGAGAGINNPDDDQLAIRLIGEDGQPIAGASMDVMRDGVKVATVTAVGNKKIAFTPEKDFFQLDDEPDFVISYQLWDEADSTRPASDVGALRVHVFPQNDRPVIRGLAKQYTYTEDDENLAALPFEVFDPDRGYTWLGTILGEGTTVAKQLDISVASIARKNGAAGDIVVGMGVGAIETDGATYSGALIPSLAENGFHVGANPDEVALVARHNLQVGEGQQPVYDAEYRFDALVRPLNDLPYLKEGTESSVGVKGDLILDVSMNEDTTGTFKLLELFDDIEDGSAGLVITSLSGAKNGTATVSGGSVRFTPPTNFHTHARHAGCQVAGSADDDDVGDMMYGWVPFVISDRDGGEVRGKIRVTVNEVNDAPKAGSKTYTAVEDTASITIENPMKLVSDVDCLDSVSTAAGEGTVVYNGLNIAALAGKGTFEGDPSVPGDYIFYPNPDETGTISLPYSVNDRDNGTGTLRGSGAIAINLTPVNDAPRMAFESFDGDYGDPAVKERTIHILEHADGHEAPHYTLDYYLWDVDSTMKFSMMEISDPSGILPRDGQGKPKVGSPVGANVAGGLHGLKKYAQQFNLNKNVNGTIVLTFVAEDNVGAKATYKVTLIVDPFNSAPAVTGGNPAAILEAAGGNTTAAVTLTAVDVESKSVASIPLTWKVAGSKTSDGGAPRISTSTSNLVYTDELGTLTLKAGTWTAAAGTSTYTYTFKAKPYTFGTHTYIIEVTDKGDPSAKPAANAEAQPKTAQFEITITVNPVNQAPTLAAGLATKTAGTLEMEYAQDSTRAHYFKAGDEVTLRWAPFVDWPVKAPADTVAPNADAKYAPYEETPVANLKYQYAYTTATSIPTSPAWTDFPAAPQMADGKLVATVIAPTGSSATYQIVVRAVDAGDYGKDVDGNPAADVGAALPSTDYAQSAKNNLDNAKPTLVGAKDPDAWTNLRAPKADSVKIILTPADGTAAQTYQSGIKKSTIKAETAGMQLAESEDGLTFSTAVTANGVHKFSIEDVVGNLSSTLSVTVNRIDRGAPTVASTNAQSRTVKRGASSAITLTYTDSTAGAGHQAGDNVSGFAPSEGILYKFVRAGDDPDSVSWTAHATGTTDPTTPTSTAKPVSVGLNLSALGRGQWTLYAKAIDRAGNEGEASFGPFMVENNDPTFAAASYAPEISEPDQDITWTFTVNVSDLDADDIANLTLSGTLEQDETVLPVDASSFNVERVGQTNAFQLRVRVPKDQFDSNEKVIMHLELADNWPDDALNGQRTGVAKQDVSLTIWPLNDAPTAPLNVAVEGDKHMPDGQSLFRAGDAVRVSWGASTDLHWAQETPDADIEYQVQYTLNGTGWTNAGARTKATSMSFAAPSGDSGRFAVRVVAYDDGTYGNGNRDSAGSLKGAAKSAISALSNLSRLDNTLPAMMSSATVKDQLSWSSEDVLVSVVLADSDPAGLAQYADSATGLVETVTCTLNGAPIDVTGSGGQVSVTAAVNGTVVFAFEDRAGNQNTYSVIVDNIDRANPLSTGIAFSPSGEGSVTAKAKAAELGVSLTFADDMNVAPDNNPSGVLPGTAKPVGEQSARHWFFEPVADGAAPSEPGAGDPRWGAAQIAGANPDMSGLEKGEYALHTKVVDNAGNVTIDVSGRIALLNNEPTFTAGDYSGAIYEDDGIWTFDVEAQDLDGADMANLDLSATVADALERGDQSPLLQDNVSVEALGGGRFRVSALVPEDRFDSEGNLVLDLALTDGDGGEAHSAATLTVWPINDAPSEPTNVEMSGELVRADGKYMFKAGDPVTVRWGASSDAHWATETPGEHIKYIVEYTLDGINWAPAAPDASRPHGPGVPQLTFRAPGGDDSAMFQVRVTAEDLGLYGNGNRDEHGALSGAYLRSEPVASNACILDNTIPAGEVAQLAVAEQWTNEGVELVLTARDVLPEFDAATRYRDDSWTGLSGLVILFRDAGTFWLPVPGLQIDGGTARATVTENGQYIFAFNDGVGNTATVFHAVDNIDMAVPIAEIALFAASEANGARGIETVAHDPALRAEIRFADDDTPALNNNMSGIVATDVKPLDQKSARHYSISQSADEPGEWIALTGAEATLTGELISLTKGNYYLHVRAIDNAGNEALAVSEAILLQNNAPAYGEDGYDHIMIEPGEPGGDTWRFQVTATDADAEDVFGLGLSATVAGATADSPLPNENIRIDESIVGGAKVFDIEATVPMDRFDSTGNLVLTLVLDDGDLGGAVPMPVTLTIWPRNDAPSEPGALSLGGGIMARGARAYKAGDLIDVSWAESSDFHWTQETPDGDLVYELEYALDGENWTALPPVVGTGATRFPAPDGDDSAQFQVRVRAVDDGLYGNGSEDENGSLTGEALASEWVLSEQCRLDNTDPEGIATQMAVTEQWTNEGVVLTLRADDVRPEFGDYRDDSWTGLFQGAAVTGGQFGSESADIAFESGAAMLTVVENGAYAFTFRDEVGNVVTITHEVNNIDMAEPLSAGIELSADGQQNVNGYEGMAALAHDPMLRAVLTFADDPANDANNNNFSDIVNTSDKQLNQQSARHYAISRSADEPGEWIELGDNVATATLAQQLTSLTKGTYYLHTRVIDNAGNERIDVSGAIELGNNDPEYDADSYDGSMVEPDGESGDTWTFDVVATDRDEADVAGLQLRHTVVDGAGRGLDAPLVTEGVSIDERVDGSNKVFTVTASVPKDRFDSEGNVVIHLELDDLDGGAVPRDVTLTIWPRNDAPTEPQDLALGGGVDDVKGRRAYRAGDSVDVSWAESGDVHWAQETPNGELVYEVEYTLDGEAWTGAGSVMGAGAHSFPAPDGDDSARFQVRVRAVDDGLYGNGNLDEAGSERGEALQSEWVLSALCRLDNTDPDGSLAQDAAAEQWTNEPVALVLTADDVQPVFDGETSYREDSLTGMYNEIAVTGGQFGANPEVIEWNNGAATVAVSENGTYVFTFRDIVGNEVTRTIAVDNIDMAAPLGAGIELSADGQGGVDGYGGMTALAHDPMLRAELAFADDPAEAANNNPSDVVLTGIKGLNEQSARHWAISRSADEPGEWIELGDNVATATLTGALTSLTKGTYYLHTRVIDNAGNERIDVSGAIALLNNDPVLRASEDVIMDEPSTAELGVREFIVAVSDIDSAADGTWDVDHLALSAAWANQGDNDPLPEGNLVVGPLERTDDVDGAPSAQFRVTMTVPVDRFDSTDALIIALTLSDGDGGAATDEYLLKVWPLNDAPEMPTITGVDAPITPDVIKLGDEVTLHFTQSDDVHWTQETAQGDLLYRVQRSLDGGETWADLGLRPHDADGFRYAVEDAGSTDGYMLRVRAEDDGTFGNGNLGENGQVAGEILWSDWDVYGPMKLDNAAPVVTHATDPTLWTKHDVTITILPTDEDVGDSGIASVAMGGLTLTEPNAANGAGYAFTAPRNGNYDFTITDNAGNLYASEGGGALYRVPIDWIDLIDPTIASSEQTRTVYAVTETIPVTLTFSDPADPADATAARGASGISGSWYQITDSANQPSWGDAGWQPYGADTRIELTERGTHYVHAKVEDLAQHTYADAPIDGRRAQAVYGPFVVLNNAPTIAVDPQSTSVRQNEVAVVVATTADIDDPYDALTVTARSGDEATIPSANIRVERAGSDQWTVTATPARDVVNLAGVPITLTVSDPHGEVATASYQVIVLHINTPPVAQGASGEIFNDEVFTGTIVANDDADGAFRAPALVLATDAASVTPRAAGGSVSASNMDVRYTPASDFEGTATFEVMVRESAAVPGNVMPAQIPDGAVDNGDGTYSVPATVTVLVKARPRPSTSPSASPSPTPSAPPRPSVEPSPSARPSAPPAINLLPDGVDPETINVPNVPHGGSGNDGRSKPIYQLPAFGFVDFANFADLGIPLGAVPTFACTDGMKIAELDVLLTELNDGVETHIYKEEILERIFDMPFQMTLPINLDEVDWENLPDPRGYELPLIVKAEHVVGKVFIRKAERVEGDETVKGYETEIEFAEGVLGSEGFASVHFMRIPQLIDMVKSQHMDPPEIYLADDIWTVLEKDEEDLAKGYVRELIPEECLSGELMLFVAAAVIYDPEVAEVWNRLPEDVQAQYEDTKQYILNHPELVEEALAWMEELARLYAEEDRLAAEALAEEQRELDEAEENGDVVTIMD